MVLAALPASFAAAQTADTPEVQDTSSVCQAPYDADFEDVSADNVHRDNIFCAADYDIALGKTATMFDPRDEVRRDQMASFIARFIETATEEELPRGEVNRFDDVSSNNVHAENIDKLAEAGVVLGRADGSYQPAADIDRDQMAAFIRRAVSFLDDGEAQNRSEPPADDSSYFDDVPVTNVHALDINALAGAGIVLGTAPREYSPSDDVRRDQMTSFIMRAFAYAEDQGLLDDEDDVVDPDVPGDPDDLTLTPQESVNSVDTDHTLTATVVDEDGNEVADGTNVRFDVFDDADGVRVGGGTATTTDGDAEFTYTSAEVREDTIVACVGTTRCTTAATADIDTETGDVLNIRTDTQSDQASKEWVARVATTLDLTPQADDNTFGQEHVVTATVRDQEGDPIAVTGDDQVRFELYRDFVEGETEDDTGLELIQVQQGDTGPVEDEETDTTGEAEFAYTYEGDVEANDTIVACLVNTDAEEGDVIDEDAETTEAPGDDDGEVFCAEVEPFIVDGDDTGNFASVTARDDRPSDEASKFWTSADLSIESLTPETSTNPSGTDHTVEAVIVDQFGGTPADETDVRFEVYRATEGGDPVVTTITDVTPDDGSETVETEDGTATFTYAGPEESVDAEDTIVACILDDDATTQERCAALGGPGGQTLIFNEAGTEDIETAEKTWVAVEDDVEDGDFTGQALAIDDENDLLDVFTDDDRFLRFAYDAEDDDFLVNGEEATADQFECAVDATLGDDAVDAEHTITVLWRDDQPFVDSVFQIETNTDVEGCFDDNGEIVNG